MRGVHFSDLDSSPAPRQHFCRNLLIPLPRGCRSVDPHSPCPALPCSSLPSPSPASRCTRLDGTGASSGHKSRPPQNSSTHSIHKDTAKERRKPLVLCIVSPGDAPQSREAWRDGGRGVGGDTVQVPTPRDTHRGLLFPLRVPGYLVHGNTKAVASRPHHQARPTSPSRPYTQHSVPHGASCPALAVPRARPPLPSPQTVTAASTMTRIQKSFALSPPLFSKVQRSTLEYDPNFSHATHSVSSPYRRDLYVHTMPGGSHLLILNAHRGLAGVTAP
ncbi:hypothetical protein E2C01_001795 [Portunus trituberculatus]|uniref:Uncharacterized protein n=1 Tax=Portunus trituberculatus TaxID=210409 RepID=A0A5B7CHL0_PORTR|nr:hypothetical protein [Portunus trituberculatus]